MGKLSDDVKSELIEVVAGALRDNMFGDGLEDDYIMDGINFVGLNNMSDAELVEEYAQGVDEDDDDDDLLDRARAELAAGGKPGRKRPVKRGGGGKRRAAPADPRLKRIKQLSRGR
jgi:hypothetical protein